MTMVILFVFGAIIGSFLNVVGLRWNSGVTLGGRSRCPSCGKTLSSVELVPILSFILSRGRCRGCSTKISKQYPVIEILTGLVFLSIYGLEFSIFNKFILALVFCIYIVIAIYDLRHKIIPDDLVYAAIVLSLIIPLFVVHYSLLDWLAGPVIFVFFASVWLLSSGRAMGFGDAKLGLSVGLLLGAAGGFSAIIFSFWLGAVYGVSLILLSRLKSLKALQLPLLSGAKNITMKSEIPFAPFIIIGAWLAIVYGPDLLNVSLI